MQVKKKKIKPSEPDSKIKEEQERRLMALEDEYEQKR